MSSSDDGGLSGSTTEIGGREPATAVDTLVGIVVVAGMGRNTPGAEFRPVAPTSALKKASCKKISDHRRRTTQDCLK